MTVNVPAVTLPPDLADYRDRRPPLAERRAATPRIDGSEMELRIVSELVRAGVSDEGIVAYFDFHLLPRYVEGGRNLSWLTSLIKTARESEKSYALKSSSGGLDLEHTNPPPHVGENEHNPAKQTYRDGVLVHRVLRQRLEREAAGEVPTLTQWRQEIIEVSKTGITKPISLSTARRMSDALVAQGYVRLEEPDKKRKLVYLDEKGKKVAQPRKWARYINLYPPQTRAKPDEAGAVDADGGTETEKVEETQKAQVVQKPTSVKAKRRPSVETTRKKHQVNGYHRITFEGNKIRYIQLLTPEDEWATGAVWTQLPVGRDENGHQMFLTVLAEDEGNDPVVPLIPWEPRPQVFAAAVELEKAKTGFKVAEYADENGEVRPTVGVIRQSESNFFARLRRYPPGAVIRVQGLKSGINRRYTFTIEEADPVSDCQFDFAAVLDTMTSGETIQRITALPPGWFYMPATRRDLVQRLLTTESAEPR